MEKQLYDYIRKLSETSNREYDKKQLRYNEIVGVSIAFYKNPFEGVRELFESCFKDSSLYTKGQPMWKSLSDDYKWMLTS
jgi:hypothetical protein